MSGGHTNLEDERLQLQQAFEHFLEQGMPEYREHADEVLRRLDLRSGPELDLSRSFSPLVALYPTLVAEALGGLEPAMVRRACLAHLLLILHAFLDDRCLDGEIEPEREDRLFCRALFLEGRLLLERELDSGEHVATVVAAREREHLLGQLLRYRTRDGRLRSWQSVRNTVVARAALGSVAWEALAIHAGIARQRYADLRVAYEHLVVGMQWEDDLVDLRADLDTGAENLVLDGAGRESRERGDTRVASVLSGELPRRRREALTALRREWTRAARHFASHGAATLAHALEERARATVDTAPGPETVS